MRVFFLFIAYDRIFNETKILSKKKMWNMPYDKLNLARPNELRIFIIGHNSDR